MSQENYCYVVSSYNFDYNDEYSYILSYEGGTPQSTYDKLEDAQKGCQRANYQYWKELIRDNEILSYNPFVKEKDIKEVKAIFEKEGIEFSSKMTDEQVERMIQLFTKIAKERYAKKVEKALQKTELVEYKSYVSDLVEAIDLPYEKYEDLEKILEKEAKWNRLNHSEILQQKFKEKVLELVELNEFYHVEKAVFVDE